MAVWKIHEAKRGFSELIRRARDEGPQTITRHGREFTVVLSIEMYSRLEAAKPDFAAYLLAGPKLDDFAVERPDDLGREVEV